MTVRDRVRAWGRRKLTAELLDRDMVIALESGSGGRADVGNFRRSGLVGRASMLTIGFLMLLIAGPLGLFVVAGLLVEGPGWPAALAISLLGVFCIWVSVVQQAGVRWMVRNVRTPRVPAGAAPR